jgi:hypothetical protein
MTVRTEVLRTNSTKVYVLPNWHILQQIYDIAAYFFLYLGNLLTAVILVLIWEI